MSARRTHFCGPRHNRVSAAVYSRKRPHEWGRGTQECVRHVHFHAIMVIKEETIAAQNAAAIGRALFEAVAGGALEEASEGLDGHLISTGRFLFLRQGRNEKNSFANRCALLFNVKCTSNAKTGWRPGPRLLVFASRGCRRS